MTKLTLKKSAEALKNELKVALEANDMATLEAKQELEQMAQQMASYAYQQQGAGEPTEVADDNVMDAQFEKKN